MTSSNRHPSLHDDGAMSSSTPKQDDVVPIAPDNVSDYGSDLDEGAFELLSQVESQQVSKAALIASIEDIPVPAEHETPGQRIHVRVSRLQQGNNSWSEDLLGSQTGDVREASVEVEYDEDNRRSFNRAYAQISVRDVKVTLTSLTRAAPCSESTRRRT